MIKGLLVGFGFLFAMTLIAVGIVRHANRLGESRNAQTPDPNDVSGPDAQ